mmetsp:Transcript_9534/g.14207  ORF Transcript_9534/g.14207 Transcript_9534/m.14207 type:complete len:217 (-) Transcript_9534:278-928(-)
MTKTLDEIEHQDELAEFWPTTYPPSCQVVQFYGRGTNNRYRCFSNFYQHVEIPFTIPDCCWDRFSRTFTKQQQSNVPRTVNVSFSETSIMLCKAAVMCDYSSYQKIIHATTPIEAKNLGRMVANFDQDIWNSVILTVAFESVYQKFQALDEQSLHTLLNTGEALIAEAAPGDRIWGVGKRIGHPNCQDPRTWQNGNILGYALMKARNILREEVDIS